MNMIDKNKMSIETSSPTSPIHVNSVISPISKNNNINYNSTQSTTNMFSNYIPHENKVMKNDKVYNTVLNNNINKAVPLKSEETNTNRKKPTYFKSKSLDLNINQLNEIVNNNQMKCINNSSSIQKLNESSTAEDSSSLRNTNDLTSNNNIGKIQSMKNGVFINKSISTLSQIAEYGTTNPKQINNMYRRGITLNNNNTVTLSANHYERNIKDKTSTIQPAIKRETYTSSYNSYLSTFQDVREIKGCTINLSNTRFAQVSKPQNLIQPNEINNKTSSNVNNNSRMNVNTYNTSNSNVNNNTNTNSHLIISTKKGNPIAYRPNSLTTCSSLNNYSIKNISKLKTITFDKGYTIQLSRKKI
jgi:hypothetical protein